MDRPKEFPIVLDQKRAFQDEHVLSNFTPEQQSVIRYRQHVLSSLAMYIGKDFKIPIHVGLPTDDTPSGWFWQVNEDGTQFIQMNAQDLLERPMEYLRFVTSHEGGHRRMSRPAEVIPTEMYVKPGFSTLLNCIEDPRTNNFVADTYTRFKDQMEMAYQMDEEAAQLANEKAGDTVGEVPRFMQAGFEYIRQWFREVKGESFQIDSALAEDVQQVLLKTLWAAREAWLRYPSRQEADSGEEMIQRYARVSYEIIRDHVWPEFQTLVQKDQEDQILRQAKKKQQSVQGGQGGQQGQEGLESQQNQHSQESKGKDSSESLKGDEKKEEGDDQKGKIENKEGDSGQPQRKSSGQLSEEEKKALKEYFDSLSPEEQQQLRDQASQVLSDFEKEVMKELESKFKPSEDAVREKKKEAEKEKQAQQDEKKSEPQQKAQKAKSDASSLEDIRKTIQEVLQRDANVYEQYRREVIPIIDQLENELREIFVKRRANLWQEGFRHGKRLNMGKRMQEKAKGVSAVQSHAWEKREVPQEKDYAFSLLVDLSSSMRGVKIEETFKSVIVLAEVLNRLSIPVEILGFNDRFYEYQPFNKQLSPEVRDHMGGIMEEVRDAAFSNEHYPQQTDTGWAMRQASERLERQQAAEKFLVVLTDGYPSESPPHSGEEFELSGVIEDITANTSQKIVGLGVGPGTGFVAEYFPNNIGDVNVEEMGELVANLIHDLVVYYDEY